MIMPKGKKEKKEPPKKAFEDPIYPNVTYQENRPLAVLLENEIVRIVQEDEWEYNPDIYHNTETIECPLRRAFDRIFKIKPKQFQESGGEQGVNVMFLGSATHEGFASLVPNSIAEHHFLLPVHDKKQITFHIDVFRPAMEGKSQVLYEIKTKDGYFPTMIDSVVKDYMEKVLRKPLFHQVSPTTAYLNQTTPYIVISQADVGLLLYIPKTQHDHLVIYKITMPQAADRELVIKILRQRAKIFETIIQQYKTHQPLSLEFIETSGACANYCNFRKMGFETNEMGMQQCPVNELPTNTQIHKSETLKTAYRAIYFALQAKLGEENDIRRKFAFYWIKDRSKMWLSLEETIKSIVVSVPTDENDALLLLQDLIKAGYAKVYKEKDVEMLHREGKIPTIVPGVQVEVIPIKNSEKGLRCVMTGWGDFRFGDLSILQIEELRQEDKELITLYTSIRNAVKWIPEEPYIEKKWMPNIIHSSAGVFNCPRLQRFANMRLTNEALDQPDNIVPAKLWWLDIVIREKLRKILFKDHGDFYRDIKFENYEMRVNFTSSAIFGVELPIILIPIFKTEWYEISGGRKVPARPIMTPFEDHTKRAALVSAVLTDLAQSPTPIPVLLVYYPRKSEGDVRLYQVTATNSEIIKKEARDWINLVNIDLSSGPGTPHVGDWCTWCPMPYRCPEGREHLRSLLARNEVLMVDGDYPMRT